MLLLIMQRVKKMFEIQDIKNVMENYIFYKKERISLIATENVTSKLQKMSYLLGLSEQYCSRLPENASKVGNLSFGNIQTVDHVNRMAREALKEIFGGEECDCRLLSGVNGLTVILYSLLEQGDVLFRMSDSCGGHLSVKPIAEKMGATVIEMVYDDTNHLGLNDFKKKYNEYKPKVIFLDSSYMLFPYPVKEIKAIVKDDALIVYDASHVISLIAKGRFQNPFEEGVDIIHSTTHKIMWGPQKSVLLFKENNEVAKKIMALIGEVLVSNTHLHHVMALLIALYELDVFGADYVDQLIENNQYFAKCLEERGFLVIGKEYNYTLSNQIWVKFENEKKAMEAFQVLEHLNISTNLIFLPKDEWGLRIGTNEITRLGMGKRFLDKLADIFYRAIISKEAVETIYPDSISLAKELDCMKVSYSFDDTKDAQDIMNMLIERYEMNN